MCVGGSNHSESTKDGKASSRRETTMATEDGPSQSIRTAATATAPAAVREKKKWPEDHDDHVSRVRQVYRRWTYSYMNAVLDKGSRAPPPDPVTGRTPKERLTQADLYAVPETMAASYLSSKFREHCHRSHSQRQGMTNRANSQRRLAKTLWKLAAPTFVPAGFCELLTVLCQVALPLLVRELIRVLEDNPASKVVDEGMPWAIAIFVCAFINSFGNHRHRHLALKSGVVLRAATVTILYEHALKLSPAGRAGVTSGELTNLVATDTQKLYEVTQEGHLIWALPLSTGLVTVFLLLILGPTALIGVATLILVVPVAERITSRMLAIRKRRIKMTDVRVGIISAMLQGIKVTKLNSYEESYEKRVTEAREKELVHLRQELAVWALSLVIIVISPMIATAASLTAYVLIDEDNILTASLSFSVLLLFSALRFPINFAGRLLGKATQAYSALQRIALFLDRDLRESDEMEKASMTEGTSSPESSLFLVDVVAPLTLSRASFYIGSEPSPESSEACDDHGTFFRVSKFDLSLQKGEVLAVCGPVGSGKSSLINGIIDEMPATSETVVTTKGTISYVAQHAFILNTTLRENILFGRPFDRELYERVLDACCLRTDIKLLGRARDLTEIGERGVTLSGGQKQRVSLARAAYAQPDVVLLDDPLSALDAGTAKLVFERLIKGPEALFSTAAVILVTHASHFLNRVDKLLVIVDGENKYLGSWDELSTFESTDDKTKGAVDFIRSSVQEESTDKGREGVPTLTDEVPQHHEEEEKIGVLMTVEEREHGLSSMKTWLLWFKHAGGIFFLFFQILFMSIDRFAYVAAEYWLARWTSGADGSIEVFGVTFPPQTDGRSAQYKYLAVYALIIVISVLATVLRSEWGVTGGARAAKNVHAAMLARVLGAPMSYFESTPMGRVLNRFTYDTEMVDITLTEMMSMFMISCSWFVAGVVVMCSIVPWMILAIVPVAIAYFVLLLHYRKSGADLQRLDAVSRSPIQAMVSEGLDGAPTIRLFDQQATFVERFQSVVDVNSSALLNFITAQRWLGLRIELLGSIVVLVASVLVVTLNDVLKIEAGLVGLLILWSSNFTITLQFLIDTFAETEAAITAIERVDAMSKLPQEKSKSTEDVCLPSSWPQNGRLKFDSVCLRYRDGLPLALNELAFSIDPGKKCGVVGRTGAGKSSLTVALFRLVEIESGRISLDDVDLSTLGLVDVRGRPNGMAIIPQDPFLAGSTLRECIDPFGQSNDPEILEALKSVRLASDSSTYDLLDSPVDEGGSNYSVGERQLLNLARALLSKPKLLVLDEATASIDGETDAFIQRMLRTKFSDTTQITVAHRLNTIMDFDQIIVMDKGKAVEVGSPIELLEREGEFAALVDATGPEGAKALRAMALSSSSLIP